MSASVRRQFRQIGAEDLHEAIQGIALATSAMLAGKTPQQVQAALGDVPGWQVESLGKGSQAGNGWVLRQYNEKGNPTGPHIVGTLVAGIMGLTLTGLLFVRTAI
ncbi:Uncharacterised protein [Mycobacteroides abscessus subsp. bolletii]|nr:hypothetical protein E3G43_002677 [Mycobacteroides abscessus]SLB58705.1 Uncharacterised protein [Mycobacteroides abscessus subsp. bolletii]SLF85397.1 Uncharacterised protein [Mycobacteroides abscessus subsp. abscessus]